MLSAFRALRPLRALATVADGQVAWEGDADQGPVLGYLREVLPGLARFLPPMKLVVNLHDEPRAWVASLPPEAEAAAAAGAGGLAAAWAAHACDGAGLAAARGVHALLSAPSQFRAARGLLPVFSSYTVPGCFAGATRLALAAPHACPACPGWDAGAVFPCPSTAHIDTAPTSPPTPHHVHTAPTPSQQTSWCPAPGARCPMTWQSRR